MKRNRTRTRLQLDRHTIRALGTRTLTGVVAGVVETGCIHPCASQQWRAICTPEVPM